METAATACGKTGTAMLQQLALVRLSTAQIANAKVANGEKRKITHAVSCGSYGQLFGTEKQCRRYFSAWSWIFPALFSHAAEFNDFPMSDYKTTFNLVLRLIEASDTISSK